jgi:hypothetical protein
MLKHILEKNKEIYKKSNNYKKYEIIKKIVKKNYILKM